MVREYLKEDGLYIYIKLMKEDEKGGKSLYKITPVIVKDKKEKRFAGHIIEDELNANQLSSRIARYEINNFGHPFIEFRAETGLAKKIYEILKEADKIVAKHNIRKNKENSRC